MRLQVRWNRNAYAIYDLEVEDENGRPILRDNRWAHGWSRIREDFDGDEELDHRPEVAPLR